MKNRIICCLISIIAFSNFSFARTIDKPKTNEVIIVARIHFSTDADRKWYLDAFDVPEELVDYGIFIQLSRNTSRVFNRHNQFIEKIRQINEILF